MKERREYRSTAWPWVALVIIALVWGWVLVTSQPAAPTTSAQSVVQIEVTRLAIVTPTYTPTPKRTPTANVVIVTATPNRTATATIPPCWEAKGGETCIRFSAGGNTPTPVPWSP